MCLVLCNQDARPTDKRRDKRLLEEHFEAAESSGEEDHEGQVCFQWHTHGGVVCIKWC